MNKIFIVLAFVFTGCSCSGTWEYRDRYNDARGDASALDAQSMMRKTVKVRHEMRIKLTEGGLFGRVDGPVPSGEQPKVKYEDVEMSGSGVVMSSSNEDDESLVLTAWHVCDKYPDGYKIKGFFYDIEVMSTKSAVLTYDSKELGYSIVVGERKHDTCVVRTEGIAGEPAELASRLPPHGALINASGAPLGVWGRYNVYFEDGRFLGRYRDTLHVALAQGDDVVDKLENFYYFSVPGMSGISGGPVWYRGKVFSIWNIGGGEWGHTGFGPNLDMLRSIMEKAEQVE